MPRLNSANNADSTLSAGITPTATSLTVADASLFPNAPFKISMNAEIIEVGAINRSTNTFSSLIRGQEGTTAASHSAGTSVQNRFTAGSYSELVSEDELTNVENTLGTTVQTISDDLYGHTGRKDNPHGVTASQVGAYTTTESDGKYAGKTLEDWKTVTTQNNWTHDATHPVQYFKDPFGFVHLRGTLYPGTLANGAVPFVLPTGYRPARDFDTLMKMITTAPALSFTSLVIYTNGNVSIKDNWSNIKFLRFDNIQFRTDA